MSFKLSYPEFWNKRGIIAYSLLPFSLIYIVLGLLRRFFSKPILLPAKTICVGNMTVGGTGKTQVVIFLAKLLKAKNIDFVVVSKGYGSKLKSPILVAHNHSALEVGDEALMLAEHASVIAAPRVRQAIPLLKKLNPSIIIIDDGMQNPSFHKDFIILVTDATRGSGNGFLLPAGPLRQSVKSALLQADAIVQVGAGSSLGFNQQGIKSFNARMVPKTILDKAKQYIAFSGIGNASRFFNLLKLYGAELLEEIEFPDHYNYTEEDCKKLEAKAKTSGAFLVTTAKDYVKIKDKLDAICYNVELALENEQEFINLLYDKKLI